MQDNFDNINGKFGENATPFIPFETAWASIKPELDKEEERRKKKKRRFVIFWFLFAGVLLGSGIFLLYNNANNHTTTVAIKNKEELKVTPKTIQNTVEKTTVNVPASNKTIADDPTVSTEKSADKDNTQNTYKTNNITTKNNAVAENKNAITKETNNKVSAIKENYSVEQTRSVSMNKASVNKKDKKKGLKALVDNKLADSSALKTVAYLNANKTKTIKGDNATVINKSIIKQVPSNNNTGSSKSKEEDTIPAVAKANIKTENKEELKTVVKTINPADTTKKKVDSINKKNAIVKAVTKPVKPTKEKSFSYGLQLNLPIADGANNKDLNANNKPLTSFIPEVWVGKLLCKKQSVSLHLNPYAQYYINNKAMLDSNSYSVTISQGSKINNGPEIIKYAEYTAANKVISFEATILYQYQVTKTIKLGIGISNCWTQGVLMQHKVIKNYSITTTDNLYGVDKSSSEWKSMNASFMLGKLEALYQFKKFAAGFNVSTPIKDLFAQKVENVPTTNTNLFIRYTIR